MAAAQIPITCGQLPHYPYNEESGTGGEQSPITQPLFQLVRRDTREPCIIDSLDLSRPIELHD